MDFYHQEMRGLQDRHDSVALADRLLATRVHEVLTPDDRAIIEAARCLLLATSDPQGRPDCSIKGGVPGFVRVVDGQLLFPDYDGNGMFRSLGNILANPVVALLFVEFDGAKRKLRIHGTASVAPADGHQATFDGAQYIVTVTPTEIYPNCPRYVPTLTWAEDSVYAPRPDYVPPDPAWKSKTDLVDVVPPRLRASEPLVSSVDRDARLARHYAQALGPQPALSGDEREVRQLEAAWLRDEERRAREVALPVAADEFPEWYRRLEIEYAEELAPFLTFLAADAPREALAYYVFVETQVDGRFDDLVAIAQIGLSGDAKLALAENYWDEMGRGTLAHMHTVLFETSAAYMRDVLASAGVAVDEPAPEVLRNGNLLSAFAVSRPYQLRLLGAMSILEHTAPTRFRAVTAGLERLGVPEEVIFYHRLHIEVDATHGDDLFRRVLLPIIQSSPSAVEEIALGARMRFNASADYYTRLSHDLQRLGLR